jgi:membrane protein DedA with SNARE-associated domain
VRHAETTKGVHEVSHFHQFLVHLLHTYGYWGLFGALALEYLFVPIPGETTLTVSGVLLQHGSYHLQLHWLILSTTLGTFLGSMIAYAIGRTFGRPVLERFGRFLRITPERIDKADALFAKYTLPVLVFSRYIAIVRIIVPYIAGINRVRLVIYVPVMFLSSLAWTSTFILAGSVIERAIRSVMHHWQTELVPAVLIFAAAVVLYYYIHRWIQKKVNQADKIDDPREGE